MRVPNAYCRKHDEVEPQDWDLYRHGLWICPKCSAYNKKGMSKPCGRKPLDSALEKVEKKYNGIAFKTKSYLEKKLDKSIGAFPDIDLD